MTVFALLSIKYGLSELGVLTVMSSKLATLYSAFSIYIQTLCSYLLLVSLCEYV